MAVPTRLDFLSRGIFSHWSGGWGKSLHAGEFYLLTMGRGVAVAGLFWEGGNARGIAGTLSATRELASMGSALLCSWCLTKLSVNATSPTPKSQVKSTNLCFLVQKICTNFCTNLYFSVLISVPICVS